VKEIILYSILYLVLFGFTDLLYHRFNVSVGYTRKIVHILTGIIALTFPVYLNDIWQAAVLCISFLGLMALSERFSWFKSITAVERKSHGSWLFAISVLICFIAFSKWRIEFFYLPILILTVADPIAAIIGKKLNYKPQIILGQTKTIGGSIAFFIATILVSIGFAEIATSFVHYNLFSAGHYYYFILIALVATIAELFSTKGWDNLTIPLSVIMMLLVYLAL
jgi:dolichol kinase